MSVGRVVTGALLAIAATLLGLLIAFNDGRVSVLVGGWEVHTSIWAGIVTIVVVTVAVVYVIKAITVFLPKNSRIAAWFKRKRSEHANQLALRALEEESNGNGVEAVRLLLAAGAESSHPTLYLLRASDLAQQIGASDKAAEIRAEVANLNPEDAPVFRRFEEARATLRAGDTQQGVRQLRRLLEAHPRCAPAISLLVEHCHETHDWTGALDYIATLARLAYWSDKEIDRMTKLSWVGRVRDANGDALTSIWKGVPKSLKQDAELVNEYLRALIAVDRFDDAAHEIERQVKQHWVGTWVRLYGNLESDAARLLKNAETWLADHPSDPDLALTLSRLHARAENSREAERYLRQSVKFGGGAEAEIELAALLVRDGSVESATKVLTGLTEKAANQ